jgi:hypothetical protein
MQRLGKGTSTVERLFSIWSAQRPLLCKRRGKYPSTITEAAFSLWSVQRLYNNSYLTRVEAGSNTSTVTLRVVGDDEKSLKSETVK